MTREQIVSLWIVVSPFCHAGNEIERNVCNGRRYRPRWLFRFRLFNNTMGLLFVALLCFVACLCACMVARDAIVCVVACLSCPSSFVAVVASHLHCRLLIRHVGRRAACLRVRGFVRARVIVCSKIV